MMKRNGSIRGAAMVAALALVSFAARAETIKLKATLDAATEVLTYHIEFKDLTGPAVAAHFHGPAAVGVNAGPQVAMTKPIMSPIDGTATLTADQAKDLLDGKWYFNVHTAANPGGEIRGQVVKAE